MGRAPCCDKVGLNKGPWTPEEDHMLITFIQKHGHTNWRALPKQAGLLRCGKSCRLRWINYLRPDIKRGNFSREEEDTIIQLHEMMGNRWSAIASRLPGRTDNEIKNMWRTHLKKRLNKQYQTTKLQHKNVTVLTIVESTSSENDSKRSDHFNYNNVMEYLPIIDETFWEPQEKLKLDDNNYYNMSSEFSNVIMEGNQFESLLREENYYDENLDFWLDVFVHAGGAHQQTEFEDP